MICRVCKSRFADFPPWEFDFVPPHGKFKMFLSKITFNLVRRNGIYPKRVISHLRRIRRFYSNEVWICSDECKELERRIEISKREEEFLLSLDRGRER